MVCSGNFLIDLLQEQYNAIRMTSTGDMSNMHDDYIENEERYRKFPAIFFRKTCIFLSYAKTMFSLKAAVSRIYMQFTFRLFSVNISLLVLIQTRMNVKVEHTIAA